MRPYVLSAARINIKSMYIYIIYIYVYYNLDQPGPGSQEMGNTLALCFPDMVLHVDTINLDNPDRVRSELNHTGNMYEIQQGVTSQFAVGPPARGGNTVLFLRQE